MLGLLVTSRCHMSKMALKFLHIIILLHLLHVPIISGEEDFGSKINTSEIVLTEGSNLTLQCPYSNKENDSIVWSYSEETINFDSVVNNEKVSNLDLITSDVLQMVNCDKKCEGNYSCQVGTKADSGSIHLFIVKVHEFFCEPLAPIRNGKHSYINDENEDRIRNGTIATFQCDDNFRIQGPTQITCDISLGLHDWNRDKPSCIPNTTIGPVFQSGLPKAIFIQNLTHLLNALGENGDRLENVQQQVIHLLEEFGVENVNLIPTTKLKPEDPDIRGFYQDLKNFRNKVEAAVQLLILQQKQHRQRLETEFSVLKESSLNSHSKLESRVDQQINHFDGIYKNLQKQIEYEIQLLVKQQDEQQRWAENEIKTMVTSIVAMQTRMEANFVNQIKAVDSKRKSNMQKLHNEISDLKRDFDKQSQCQSEVIPLLESKIKTIQDMSTATSKSLASAVQHIANLTLAHHSMVENQTVIEFVWTVDNFHVEKSNRFLLKYFYTEIPGYKLALDLRPNAGIEPFIMVYLRIFEGIFDTEIAWPALYECEMSILSQSEGVEDIVESEKLRFPKERDEYVDTFLMSVSDVKTPHVKDVDSPYVLNDKIVVRFRMKTYKA